MASVIRQFGPPVDVLRVSTRSHPSGITRRLRGFSPEEHPSEQPVRRVRDAAVAAALGEPTAVASGSLRALPHHDDRDRENEGESDHQQPVDILAR